jgi:hypothetical protein
MALLQLPHFDFVLLLDTFDFALQLLELIDDRGWRLRCRGDRQYSASKNDDGSEYCS